MTAWRVILAGAMRSPRLLFGALALIALRRGRRSRPLPRRSPFRDRRWRCTGASWCARRVAIAVAGIDRATPSLAEVAAQSRLARLHVRAARDARRRARRGRRAYGVVAVVVRRSR